MKYGLVLSWCAFLVGCGVTAPPRGTPVMPQETGASVLPLPDNGEVTRIEISLEDGEGLKTCLVAPADYAGALDLFAGGVVDEHPARWEVFGGIEIEYRDGRRIYATWFRVGERGAYKIGETYYRGASDRAFIDVFRNCGRSGKPLTSKSA